MKINIISRGLIFLTVVRKPARYVYLCFMFRRAYWGSRTPADFVRWNDSEPLAGGPTTSMSTEQRM